MIEPYLSDDAFLADLNSAPASPDRLDLWWLGQSGFIIQQGVRLCIDPYLSDSLTRKYENTDKPHVRLSRRVVDPARLGGISLVISTHAHTDHLDAETLQPILANPTNLGASFIYSQAHEATVKQRLAPATPTLHPMNPGDALTHAGLTITAIRAQHGEMPALGYVIKGKFTVFHAGDGIVYPGLADQLKPFNIDVAILPINGKLDNMDGPSAARLAKEINALVAIPCHYDMFEFNTASPTAFTQECERLAQPYVVPKLGERITLED
ncbi:MAG TPA: MBL fold metallo-hydrolase [Tepidisphaeraceae bacterium]|jgi:L-ascorbate metabolism protein UlaG (beta-lactamase superfamily)